MSEPSLEEFWQACGGDGELRLLIEHDEQLPRGAVFPTPFTVIGSADACDLVLDDALVSRRHAYLQVIDGRIWCSDLLSRTGVHWGDYRGFGKWFDSSIRIGPYQLRAMPREGGNPEIPQTPSNPLAAIVPEDDTLPSVTLEFLNAHDDYGLPTTWRLDRILTFVGQSQFCKVRFASQGVSRIHCTFLRTPQGVWVIDLLGRHGISVNGDPLRWARLRAGDHLRVGTFSIGIQDETVPTSEAFPRNGGDSLSRPPSSDVLPVFLGSGVEAEQHQENQEPTALPRPRGRGRLTHVAGRGAVQQAMVPSPASGDLVAATAMGGLAATTAMPGVLQAFVNQFTVMHQQMFQQFQQSALMMMQMFCSMQKEQFDVVRRELEHIRALNGEINSLQEELAKLRARPSTRAETTTPATKKPVPPRPATKGGAAAPKERAKPKAAPDETPTPARGPRKEKPAEATPVNGSSSSTNDQGGPEVHDWLCQRFNELQQERQSRWQRLVNKLLGK